MTKVNVQGWVEKQHGILTVTGGSPTLSDALGSMLGKEVAVTVEHRPSYFQCFHCGKVLPRSSRRSSTQMAVCRDEECRKAAIRERTRASRARAAQAASRPVLGGK